MLVLSRHQGERIRIGQDITLVVNRIEGQQVRLAIDAPASVKIYREELLKRLKCDDQEVSPSDNQINREKT